MGRERERETVRRAWQLTPVFLLGESPWTEEPGGLQSLGSQSQTRMSTSLGRLGSQGDQWWDSCLLPGVLPWEPRRRRLPRGLGEPSLNFQPHPDAFSKPPQHHLGQRVREGSPGPLLQKWIMYQLWQLEHMLINYSHSRWQLKVCVSYFGSNNCLFLPDHTSLLFSALLLSLPPYRLEMLALCFVRRKIWVGGTEGLQF